MGSTERSKKLLGNIIRHTESHNRRVEEGEMWALRASETTSKYGSSSHLNRKRRQNFGDHDDRDAKFSKPTSSKWAAELQQYEESLGTERWGHGGYKELYPEEFGSKSKTAKDYESSSEDDNYSRKKNKRKRRASSDSITSEEKLSKRRKAKSKHKKSKKKKKSKHKSS